MSYLHINGYAIPIESCEPTHQHIAASMGYSPNGVYQLSRNGYARAWKCRSGLLTTAERHAMMAILGHRGDGWRFNLSAASNGVVYITDATSPEVYSDKFKVPKSAEAVATIMAAYGADGARVYDWNGNPYGPFDGSTGSVLVEPGTTNIAAGAPNSQYDPANTTGFSLLNAATINHNTANYWVGDGCVEAALTGGAPSNAGVQVTGFTGLTDYCISAFIKVDRTLMGAAPSIRTRIYDVTGATNLGVEKTFTPAASDRWIRVYNTGSPAGGAGSSVSFRVWVNNNTTAASFFIDGVHAESLPAGSFPTAPVDPDSDPWGSGSGIRPAGILDYDTFLSTHTEGFSVALWANRQITGAAASNYLFDTGDGNPRAVVYITTAGVPTFQLVHSYSGSLVASGSGLTTGWHHIIGVYDRDLNTAYLYVDGVQAGTDDTWTGDRDFFDIESSAGDFSIGSAGAAGSNMCPGPIGSVQVLPYAMPATVIAGMYDSAQQVRLPPGVLPLSVHGDALQLGERWIQATATLDAAPHNSWWNGPTFESGGGRVAFTLNETVRRSA